MIVKSARDNYIRIENSTFTDNRCQNGGGGVQLGYTVSRQRHSKRLKANSIKFQNCVFN